MQVYIRHAVNGDSQHFAEVATPEEFEKLFAFVKKVGVHAEGDTYHAANVQIVCDDNDGAYVELIVG